MEWCGYKLCWYCMHSALCRFWAAIWFFEARTSVCTLLRLLWMFHGEDLWSFCAARFTWLLITFESSFIYQPPLESSSDYWLEILSVISIFLPSSTTHLRIQVWRAARIAMYTCHIRLYIYSHDSFSKWMNSELWAKKLFHWHPLVCNYNCIVLHQLFVSL